MTEWQVVWVPDLDRWGALPVEGVLGVRDLPAAVARIGLRPGDPVFVAPDGTVDPELLEFVLSGPFRYLERETKRNYATDIRPLLSFLSSRGVPWRRACRSDLADYRDWRCRSMENPQRVGGTRWNREAAAFTKLFRWARVEPLPVDAGRREDRAADSHNSTVLLLTPRTWGLWSDIGLRGHTGTGSSAPGWKSRTELRNTGFVQLLLGSGLRCRREPQGARDHRRPGSVSMALPRRPARTTDQQKPQGQRADSGTNIRVVEAVAPQVRGQLGDRTEQEPCRVRWGISEGVESAGHRRGDGGRRAAAGLQDRLRPGE
ncbi:site-specific integrase [Streptomyces sp. NPDC091682]|uniref:site-specific integrase n=1 Tax=Streptomyces sp. NPDC091682 TaxID=3366005 RepID=UPI00381FDF52